MYYNVRSAAILTNAFVAGTILAPNDVTGNKNANPSGENQLIVYVKFTLGSLTDGQVKIEFSHDGTNFYQESFSSISAGVDTVSLGAHKFTASGNYRIAVPIKDNFIRISAIGTGTVTSSSMTVDATLGTV